MKFITLPGYKIRVDKITGVSDIERSEEVITNSLTKEKEKKILFHLALFFDGNKIEWYFGEEEKALELKKKIDVILEDINARNIL
jgi:hypothetical protein